MSPSGPSEPREGAPGGTWRPRPEGVGPRGSQELCAFPEWTLKKPCSHPPSRSAQSPRGLLPWASEEGIYRPLPGPAEMELPQKKEDKGPWSKRALGRACKLGRPLPSVNATLAPGHLSHLTPGSMTQLPEPPLREQLTPPTAAGCKTHPPACWAASHRAAMPTYGTHLTPTCPGQGLHVLLKTAKV